jgi:hypothetical protein
MDQDWNHSHGARRPQAVIQKQFHAGTVVYIPTCARCAAQAGGLHLSYEDAKNEIAGAEGDWELLDYRLVRQTVRDEVLGWDDQAGG